MKLVISGATGFIGRALVGELARENHEMILLTRKNNFDGLFSPGGCRYATWDGRSSGDLPDLLSGCDAIVNLAGESMAGGRWTPARKRVLVESRVLPTRALVRALRDCQVKPRVLVNASAVGIYGNVVEEDVTEDRPAGAGFLPDLCREWEGAAAEAVRSDVRVVQLRTGVVVGPGSTALKRLALPFRFFVGGSVGSGRQWFPWIHLDDVTGFIGLAIRSEAISGPVNLASPRPVRMKEFSRKLGRALGRPSWVPVPAFVLRLVTGELAEMVLGGQKIVPGKLLKNGYRYRFPELDGAMADAFSRM